MEFIGKLFAFLLAHNLVLFLTAMLEHRLFGHEEYMARLARQPRVVGLVGYVVQYPLNMWTRTKSLPLYGIVWASTFVICALVFSASLAVVGFFAAILSDWGMSVQAE